MPGATPASIHLPQAESECGNAVDVASDRVDLLVMMSAWSDSGYE